MAKKSGTTATNKGMNNSMFVDGKMKPKASRKYNEAIAGAAQDRKQVVEENLASRRISKDDYDICINTIE